MQTTAVNIKTSEYLMFLFFLFLMPRHRHINKTIKTDSALQIETTIKRRKKQAELKQKNINEHIFLLAVSSQ